MAKEEKLRSEIDDKYKWDLDSMYASKEVFKNDIISAEKMIDELVSYKGIVTKDANTLYNFLKLEEKLDVILTNLYVYAESKKNEDLSNEENQKMYNEILNLLSISGEKTSFVMPELMKTSYDVIKKYISENDKLKEFTFDLEQIYRYQKYTLSEKEETLLGNIGDLRNKFENNFNVALYSMVDYGYIKDEDGNEVKLTNGNMQKYARSKDRRVRHDSFKARYNALQKYAGLIATDYEGSVKADVVIAKARGYKSDLEMHLYEDGVPEEIYRNLLKVSDDNINVFHKYIKMVKDVLKLKDFSVYDLSAPLTGESDKKYSVSDAKKMITKALGVLGKDYVKLLNKAFDERWIDFYPNKGKHSGYYEQDSYVGHPLVLSNYTEDYVSVSSLAHELGHAINSYYSKENNPPHLSEYTLFTAEVASLTNEILFSNYIIKNSTNKTEKLIAIEYMLSVIAGNFYGTISEGSVFEDIVHKRIFDGESLTESDFNEIFSKVKDRYYGNDIIVDDMVKYGWTRVSHFYNSFYYYKYSVGICGACYVARRILSGDKEYLNRYLEYLKLGGSMMPLEELKQIDLDFTDTKVIEEGINYFSELIDEFMVIYNS